MMNIANIQPNVLHHHLFGSVPPVTMQVNSNKVNNTEGKTEIITNSIIIIRLPTEISLAENKTVKQMAVTAASIA